MDVQASRYRFYTLNYACIVSVCGELYSIFIRRSAQLHLVGGKVPVFPEAFFG